MQGGKSIAYGGLESQVLRAVPGGGTYEVVYNSNAEYMLTPKQGAASGIAYIKGQIAKCPQMVFVMLGYSKGVNKLFLLTVNY